MEPHDPIRELLDRVRARWQALRAFQATVRAGLAASAVLIVALLVVRGVVQWAGRPPLVLAILAAVTLLLAVGAIAWAVAPLRHRPSDARVARFIEERAPALDDRLASAVDLIDGPPDLRNPAKAGSHVRGEVPGVGHALQGVPHGSAVDGSQRGSDVRRAMLADAAARAREIDVDTILPAEALRRSGFQAAAALLLLIIVGGIASVPARDAWDAASLALFPSRVSLEVRPGDARVNAGMPLAIEARLVGNRATVVARVEVADGGQWRTVDMARDPAGTFRLALDSITAPFKYRVTAGAVTSATFSVSVARIPRVTGIDLDYVYPAALGLKPRSERDGGDIYAPAGTRVHVRVHTDREVASARMTLNNGNTVSLATETPTVLSATLTIVEDNAYRVALADREGLSNPGDTEYFIRVLEDRPPDVHITRPAGDRGVTRLEEVDIEAQADDDYGIERLELVYAVRGGTEHVIALPVPSGATSVSARHTLYFEDLDVQPGDFVSYYLRVRDVTRGQRSNQARSDIFFLEVRPFEQEFSLTESQSMSGSGYNGAIDELVNAQRQVIVATWKLDRRAQDAGGARSERDIRAVARTEADVKARVEQTASAFRESTMRDPRGPSPGTGSRPAAQARPEEDAMAAAANAMGQAVASLEKLETGSALPPEMRALNSLLKAQAEIKRRQLSLDPSAGAADNASRNYDISTLFDRELRRQQQTSYETPKSAQKPEQSGGGTLDKIKELARRQDELLRRQQEVARGRLSPEARTRELEQLTREQSELRQRAEDLERQMSGQRSTDQSAGAGGERDNRRQMREISDEMRQAAGDLRRGSPQEAGGSGGRALDKLRDLERRLQSSRPDERRRALGEMQLEARQLADGQRQIASELSKLDQKAPDGPGPTGQDAMRRLAGDQQRLADRARRLQTGLQQQAVDDLNRAKAADQRAQAAVGDTARDFARLSEQMQQSADQMRAAGGGPMRLEGPRGPGGDKNRTQQIARPQVSAQQELARLLDRVADRLSAASGGRDDESRKLSEQLGRTQELREKLEQASRAIESAGRQTGRTGGERSTQKAAGESGRTGEGRMGAGGIDMTRLREESLRQLRDTQDLLDDLQRQDPSFSKNGAGFTFEGQGLILSAPGTEAFKQDVARWETLKRQATVALERAESTLSKKLLVSSSKDRLAAGADDNAPAEYRKQVDAYFKAIAAGKKP
jgi:uncharacterized protein DUF4175